MNDRVQATIHLEEQYYQIFFSTYQNVSSNDPKFLSWLRADLLHKTVDKSLAIDFQESKLLGFMEYEFILKGLTTNISILLNQFFHILAEFWLSRQMKTAIYVFRTMIYKHFHKASRWSDYSCFPIVLQVHLMECLSQQKVRTILRTIVMSTDT